MLPVGSKVLVHTPPKLGGKRKYGWVVKVEDADVVMDQYWVTFDRSKKDKTWTDQELGDDDSVYVYSLVEFIEIYPKQGVN